MNKSDFRGIFPLPLTPFEEYMFLDANRGYPMVVPVTLVFKGDVNFELLSVAFDETVSREPLFHAVIQRDHRQLFWVDSGKTPRLEFVTENPIAPNCDRGIDDFQNISIDKNNQSDADNQTGFYCSFTPSDGGFVIRIRIHHSVSDGMAILLFIANWFAKYGELVNDIDGLETCYPDPVKIKERDNLLIKLPCQVSKLSSAISFYHSVWDWFTRSLCRIRNWNPQLAAEHEHFLQNWNFDNFKTTTDQIQTDNNLTADNFRYNNSDGIADSNSNSNSKIFWSRLPNDLSNAIQNKLHEVRLGWSPFILAEYFKFIRSWMANTDVMPPREKRNWIRILYPMNFRLSAHRGIPSSNILGFAFIDRRFDLDFCNDKFYYKMNEELKHITDWSMGSMFLTGLGLCRRIPFLLPRIMQPQRCLTTSIFTVIGNPCLFMPQKRFRKLRTVRVADLELCQIIGSPPIRPNTPVSFAMTKQHNEITFSNIIDINLFGVKNAALFHDLFIDQLRQSVGLKK
jgi:hypothetical protein